MNERIRELLNEATCGLEPDLSLQRTVTLNEMEKFAELIVKECVDCAMWVGQVNRNPVEPINTAHAIKMRIEKHFGVEECPGWVCSKCGVDRTKEVCPKGYMAAVTGDCPMTATAQTGIDS